MNSDKSCFANQSQAEITWDVGCLTIVYVPMNFQRILTNYRHIWSERRASTLLRNHLIHDTQMPTRRTANSVTN